MPRKKMDPTATPAPPDPAAKPARKRAAARPAGQARAPQAASRARRTKTAAGTAAAAPPAAPMGDATEQIARLAHALYEARQRRGEVWGTPEGDWAYAEALYREGVTHLE